MKKPDKYGELRSKIRFLFHENKQRYGYRRIYGLLKRENITVSEKIVRQITREEGLVVRAANGAENIVLIREKYPHLYPTK
ncbi:IS3 family transposase [bacterium 210820-DFI.6.37]|nr:IS3 family transposase [bacterium 210820-DFI.6.37]